MNTPFKAVVGPFLLGFVCLVAAAQDKQSVDWEAKMLTTELMSLGDPEINMMLPELYKALAESREEQADAAAPDGPGAKRKTAPKPTLMSLLNNPSVRHEIEMLDSQFEEIQTKNREIQSRTSEQVFSLLMSSRDGSVDHQTVRDGIREIRQDAAKEIEKVILPFQFERLRQIAYQVQMRRQSVVDVLTTDPLATELGLTDQQKGELREKAREINDELAREIAKLRSKAKQKLFSHLRQDQQRKLSAIVGAEFDYQEIDWPKKLRQTAGSKAKP
jgi:hypothetical protein